MTAPIALTDEQMDAVMQAAVPIDPAQRDAFLRDIATELAKCPEQLGPGSVYRRDPRDPTQVLHAAADMGRDRQTVLSCRRGPRPCVIRTSPLFRHRTARTRLPAPPQVLREASKDLHALTQLSDETTAQHAPNPNTISGSS